MENEINQLKSRITQLEKSQQDISSLIVYQNTFHVNLFEKLVNGYIHMFLSNDIFDPNEQLPMSFYWFLWTAEKTMFDAIDIFATFVKPFVTSTFYFDWLYKYQEPIFVAIIQRDFSGPLTFEQLMSCLYFVHTYLDRLFETVGSGSREQEYKMAIADITDRFNIL